MDTLAHGLYGVALAAKSKNEKLMFAAAVSGMMPDVLVYGSAFVQLGIAGGWKFITDPNPAALSVPVSLYYYTHSFLTVLVLAGVLYLIKKKWVILALPYALHIFFDIFLHCGLFATRFLYPLSDFHICGVNYADHWWAWEANYGVLVLIFWWIYRKYYKMS